MATILTDKMRNAVRLSNKADALTEEINDCIAACEKDLTNAGIVTVDETDALIVRAVTLYVKAEFGFSDKAADFKAAYNALKQSLLLSGDYNTATGS